MSQYTFDLGEYQKRVLDIVKGKYGMKNKSEALRFIIERFGEELLEPALKPEFRRELLSIDKGRFKKYRSIEELFEEVENAPD
jgi:hypothetical protein